MVRSISKGNDCDLCFLESAQNLKYFCTEAVEIKQNKKNNNNRITKMVIVGPTSALII